MVNLENQTEIFALTPLTSIERDSIDALDSVIGAAERLIRNLQNGGMKHLEKASLHSDLTAERFDLIISSLQKIRRAVLAGEGVKKALIEKAA